MHDALIERLRDGLADAAGGIEVGDPTVDLPATHRTARRRRNRNRALGAVLGVAAVGTAAAVVAALTTTDPDSIRTITPATTVPDENEVDDGDEDTSGATTTTDAPGTTVPAEDGAATEDGATVLEDSSAPIVGSSRVAGGRAAAAPAAGVDFNSFLMPWADGFIAGSIDVVQPSTELSEEMQARFPQEVQDLFPGGELPPTVQETTAIISEAGYYLQVFGLLDENPDIRAAVFSKPEYSVITAEFSTDGERWTPFQIEVPDEVALISEIVVVGDRLVVAGTPEQVPNTLPTIGAVASTTDLAEWTVQTFPTGLPAELPDTFEVYSGGIEVVATEVGWLAFIDAFVDIDVPALLTEDLVDVQNFDTTEETEGLRVSAYGDGDVVLAERLVPWSEIGLDRDDFEELLERLQDGPRGAGRFVATWDGQPAHVDAGELFEIEPLATGYLANVWLGESSEIRFSTDGLTWVSIPAAPPRQRIVGTIAVDDATMVITEDNVQEHHLYRVDATGQTWREIDVDGLPPSLRDNWQQPAAAGRGGIIVDGSVPEVFEWNATVEHDGLRLEAALDRTSASYRVVDVATGDVVAEESVDLRDVDQSWDPFTDFEFDREGWTTVTEPGSATVVARFPADVLQQARNDAERAIYGGPGPLPDQWFIATVDGVEWIVGDIEDTPEGEEFAGFDEARIAVNGRNVLVGSLNGWSVYEL